MTMSADERPGEPAETRRLYFEDSYLTEFEAAVTAKLKHQGKPAVVLDQTCFYPESGGQPADHGTLDGVEVIHVFEEDERIIHLLGGEPAGIRVKGIVDWTRRFDHMQQHSGQHILSQSFIELLAGETMSFHLGEMASTLEIGIKEVRDVDIDKVEARANAVVFSDLEIRTYLVPPEKIEAVPLRRPPKKEGWIRVVEIGGFDYSACGGTHCRRTGEIGLIKITKWDRIRGNLRFEFLCGRRALRDYAWKNRAMSEMGARLSAHEKDVPAALEKLSQEVREARKRLKKLQEQTAVYEAQEIIEKAEGRIVSSVWTEKTPEEAKMLALHIIRAGEYAVLFAVRGEEKDHLIFASSDRLSLNMRDLVPLVLSLVQGKGGGGPTLVELIVDKGGNLDAVLAAAVDFLRKQLR
jgi:alanyl-tRNA synthetase